MTDDDSASEAGVSTGSAAESRLSQSLARTVHLTRQFVHIAEVAAAAVFAILFAIGVVDLARRIVQAFLTGRITEPLVVVEFVDIGLLLLIIVEVYQTVIAYVQGNDEREIVRLVIYAGVIAMVRKAIIFRTGSYPTTQSALLAAVAYTVLIGGLIGLLHVERVHEE